MDVAPSSRLYVQIWRKEALRFFRTKYSTVDKSTTFSMQMDVPVGNVLSATVTTRLANLLPRESSFATLGLLPDGGDGDGDDEFAFGMDGEVGGPSHPSADSAREGDGDDIDDKVCWSQLEL